MATSIRRCMPGPRSSRIVWKGAKRPRRQGMAQEQLPEAAAEFHLVGQPQGSSGRNVFEGGFLGLDNIGVFDRSAPLPTGGYLEQADGTAWMALFCQNMLEIAAELAKTDRGLRRHGGQILRALPVDRLVDGARGRRHRNVGRGGRLLLRRAAFAQRPVPTAQSPVDGGPAAAVRGHDFDGVLLRTPRKCRTPATIYSGAARNYRPRFTIRRSRVSRPPLPRFSTKTNSAACSPRCSTRTNSSASSASARCRGSTPSIRTSFHAGGQEYRVALSAGRIRHRHVRRQLQLARSDLDAGQRPDYPRPAAILRLLRQRFQGGVPHRLRTHDDLVPGGRGDFPPARKHIPEGRGRAGGQSTAAPRNSRRSALARSHAVLRILPWRQRGRPRRQPSDRLDRHHRPRHAPLRDDHAPNNYSNSARWPR